MDVNSEKLDYGCQQATMPKPSEQLKNVSVFKYFTSELTRGYKLEREEQKYAEKRQRVYTFMKTPRELEKFCIYGFFQCVDAFLFVFTFLPLRIMLAFLKLLTHPCGFTRSRTFLQPAQICDILKGIILVVCFFIMSYIDTSMMYHIVRGQATIKLYVFFNMLDTADRLLSNFGHDILDALFWTATEPRGRRREHLGTLPHLLLAIIYVILHTMLILFQATILNVAFNSYNKALLVIMMSNNFVEIKGSLFRKVDLNHLYTISCSDVKERFHYVILLSLVVVRNLTEAKWDLNVLWVLLPDALLVLIAELCVDWGKHAFILKFNEIPADVYREYKVKLALDMAASRQNHAFTDHSDLVSRRMGLTPLPLTCLIFRILTKSIKERSLAALVILVVILLCLTTFKVLNSIVLLGHSYKVIEEYDKEQQESPNENTGSDTPTQQTNKSTNKTDDRTESTNQNQSSKDKNEKDIHVESGDSLKSDDSIIENISFVKHKRSASCDDNVKRNFSEILMADSYTELTMLTNIDVIERSKDPTLNKVSLIETVSENDLNNDDDNESDSSVEQLVIEKDDIISEEVKEIQSQDSTELSEKEGIPIQESVFIMQSEREKSVYPKSERFFVDLSHRSNSNSKDSKSEEIGNEMNKDLSNDKENLEVCIEDSHVKKD